MGVDTRVITYNRQKLSNDPRVGAVFLTVLHTCKYVPIYVYSCFIMEEGENGV